MPGTNTMDTVIDPGDERRLEDLKPIAKMLAQASGKPIKLVCFETRVDLETFEP